MIFPQTESGPHPEAIREFAITAERLGFSHLLAYDHVLGGEHANRTRPVLAGGYTEKHPFHEVLVLFGYLAGITTTIEFVTGVLVLPQRQTALVAKQAAELALLSGDRFRMGVGVGWNHIEYDALGQDFGTRGRREEEQIALLRELWTTPLVTFEGRFDQVERAGLAPLPDRPVQIWLGGKSDIARDRAARVGDGFIFSTTPQPEDQVELGLAMRAHVESLGRDPASFGLEGRVEYKAGTDAWKHGIDVLTAAGFDYATVNLMGAGLSWPDGHLEALEEIASLSA